MLAAMIVAVPLAFALAEGADAPAADRLAVKFINFNLGAKEFRFELASFILFVLYHFQGLFEAIKCLVQAQYRLDVVLGACLDLSEEGLHEGTILRHGRLDFILEFVIVENAQGDLLPRLEDVLRSGQFDGDRAHSELTSQYLEHDVMDDEGSLGHDDSFFAEVQIIIAALLPHVRE